MNEQEIRELIKAHVQECLNANQQLRKDSQDVGGVFRSNVNQFVMSVAIIYAVRQDAYMRTSTTEVFEMAIWYLLFSLCAISVNIFLANHILTIDDLIGRNAFRAFYHITTSVQQYYIFLLINLAKEQFAKNVSEDSWDHYNLIPITFTVTVYYVFEEIRASIVLAGARRKIKKSGPPDIDTLVHTFEAAQNKHLQR